MPKIWFIKEPFVLFRTIPTVYILAFSSRIVLWSCDHWSPTRALCLCPWAIGAAQWGALTHVTRLMCALNQLDHTWMKSSGIKLYAVWCRKGYHSCSFLFFHRNCIASRDPYCGWTRGSTCSFLRAGTRWVLAMYLLTYLTHFIFR